ncbi:BTB/POZ domain-containing protein [Ditylenchus destructor]|nr:BTB/POZ domain-containing protein [Ditylenchus destructor]
MKRDIRQLEPSKKITTVGVAQDEENEDDPYKPDGFVELRIDRFREFARGTSDSQQRLSTATYIRGLPWKILAIPREIKTLGFFLQCNGDTTDTTWNCQAIATLRIVSQKEGVEDNVRRIVHNFYSKENDWGYSQFVSCAVLVDPNNGFVKDDTVILLVEVNAEAPHGVHKKHTGHIGLKNQGATCYMNSILQTFFFTNKLRKAVYMMPTEEDDQESSVALAMQRVFYELQFSEAPVGTKKLTKSFGWDSVDSFLHHDVQELCRVLLLNLKSKMKSTVVEDTIPLLFKGRMKSYIKCKNVDFESSSEESYYDVQLNVKGRADIIDSFRDYTEPEVLDGDNKYDTGVHGLQPAEKGVKFLSFPPVLHLQLMRFQYDPALDTNVKINDRFVFPEELKLDEFVGEHGEKDDYTYLLHAVLVHSGDFHGGHYVVFINTGLKEESQNLKDNASRWCKFDDCVISRAAVRDAVQANYGGDDPEMICRSYTNAYMLVYVKKNAIRDVLCPVSEEDIPVHLKVRFENEKKRDVQCKKEAQIFSSSSPYPSDCVIVLKNKKEVHVNKIFLSIHSKYFKEQFTKNDESKEVLDDVTYDDFVELLYVVYPTAHPITARNVEAITKLAYKLVMPEMLNRCEVFLTKNKQKFHTAKLLLMAQEYSLEHLQAQCISEHKSIDDVKTIRNEPEYTSLDNRTKRMLLDRILGTSSTSALPLSSVPESSNAASKPTVVTRTAAILEVLASLTDCPPDIVLIVGDKRIQAHKQYLSIYSKYFNAMFQSEFKEGRENEIELEEIGYDEIVELLSVVYPSEFSITDTNVGTVLKLADRFLMPAILTQCKKVLKTRKAIKGARKLWYAQRYNFEDLRDEFARGCKNIADVMKMKVEPEFELLDDDTRALILDNITR